MRQFPRSICCVCVGREEGGCWMVDAYGSGGISSGGWLPLAGKVGLRFIACRSTSNRIVCAQTSPRKATAALRNPLVATRNKSRVSQHLEQSTLSNRRPDLSSPMAEPIIDEALREVSPLPPSYLTLLSAPLKYYRGSSQLSGSPSVKLSTRRSFSLMSMQLLNSLEL